jgi:hypothetical protein
VSAAACHDRVAAGPSNCALRSPRMEVQLRTFVPWPTVSTNLPPTAHSCRGAPSEPRHQVCRQATRRSENPRLKASRLGASRGSRSSSDLHGTRGSHTDMTVWRRSCCIAWPCRLRRSASVCGLPIPHRPGTITCCFAHLGGLARTRPAGWSADCRTAGLQPHKGPMGEVKYRSWDWFLR